MIAMHLGQSGIIAKSMDLQFVCKTTEGTQALAKALGEAVRGGEVLAFHSDLGGGKTTFVKGLAVGMGVTDLVQSPTFTLSQLHQAARGLELHHYDFYRLTDAGVMRDALTESLTQNNAVTAVEWGDIVHDILPADSINITLRTLDEEARAITIACPKKFEYIIHALQNYQQNRTLASL